MTCVCQAASRVSDCEVAASTASTTACSKSRCSRLGFEADCACASPTQRHMQTINAATERAVMTCPSLYRRLNLFATRYLKYTATGFILHTCVATSFASSCRSRCFGLIVAAFLLPSSSFAQSPTTPTITAGKLEASAEGPTIDGRVTDAVWQGVAPYTTFTQQDPIEGAPASERTEDTTPLPNPPPQGGADKSAACTHRIS